MSRRRSVRRIGLGALNSRVNAPGMGAFTSTARLDHSAGHADSVIEPPENPWIIFWAMLAAGFRLALAFGWVALLFSVAR